MGRRSAYRALIAEDDGAILLAKPFDIKELVLIAKECAHPDAA